MNTIHPQVIKINNKLVLTFCNKTLKRTRTSTFLKVLVNTRLDERHRFTTGSTVHDPHAVYRFSTLGYLRKRTAAC